VSTFEGVAANGVQRFRIGDVAEFEKRQPMTNAE
jgi:hypothetical protein